VTKLFDLGERRIIQMISNILTEGDSPVGIGDDCAIIEYYDDFILLTTDMISKKTHIPDVMTDWQIGWFIVSINLSDIAAKGGSPLGVLLAFGFPGDLKSSRLEEIVKGANDCAVFHNTSIIGGDMKENPDMVLSGCAVGSVKKDEFMGRSGAKPGDIIAVTGDLGKAAAGYLASNNKIVDKNILNGLFKPMPRIKTGRKLAESEKIHCCMDLSDGLSSTLYQLKEMNKNVGFQINAEMLPVSSNLSTVYDKLKNFNVLDYTLHFGGDYELLFTISEDDFLKMEKNYIDVKITKIGRVTKDDEIKILVNKKSELLPNKGYEHFKPSFY
jgi:thiamine-monophosphate kinase